MRIFLDTNVILDYLLDSRGKFHEPAVKLMRQCAAGLYEAGFSTSQVTDLYYCIRKAAGNETARTTLRGLFALCSLFPTPESACLDALESPIKDFEDAVQALTALHYQCDCLITRDLKDYATSPIPCYNPADFLKLLDGESDLS